MVMEFDNIETVKRAVEIEAGVAVVPVGTVTQEVAKQTLVAIPFSKPIPNVPSRSSTAAAGAFARDATFH